MKYHMEAIKSIAELHHDMAAEGMHLVKDASFSTKYYISDNLGFANVRLAVAKKYIKKFPLDYIVVAKVTKVNGEVTSETIIREEWKLKNGKSNI